MKPSKLNHSVSENARLALLSAIRDALDEIDKRLFVLTTFVEAIIEEDEN
jgi:hypothetical protein